MSAKPNHISWAGLRRPWHMGWLLLPGLAATLSGCGGGGGSSAAVPLPFAVTGTLQSNTNPEGGASTPLAGYQVTFDQNAGVTATSQSNGRFVLSVPRSVVTGTDTLFIYDSSGTLVDTVPVPATLSSTTAFNAGLVKITPPGAPGSLVSHPRG